jgi:DNA-binding MarR family transcriptional regulator
MSKQKIKSAKALAAASDLRAVISQLRRRMRDEGHARVFTPSQRAVVMRLEKDGAATVTALANAEGVRQQSMGATIATLEAAGYVQSQSHPDDGRQKVVSLTDNCRQIINDVRAAREDWLFRAMEAKLSVDDQQVLTEAIELLKRLVE